MPFSWLNYRVHAKPADEPAPLPSAVPDMFSGSPSSFAPYDNPDLPPSMTLAHSSSDSSLNASFTFGGGYSTFDDIPQATTYPVPQGPPRFSHESHVGEWWNTGASYGQEEHAQLAGVYRNTSAPDPIAHACTDRMEHLAMDAVEQLQDEHGRRWSASLGLSFSEQQHGSPYSSASSLSDYSNFSHSHSNSWYSHHSQSHSVSSVSPNLVPLADPTEIMADLPALRLADERPLAHYYQQPYQPPANSAPTPERRKFNWAPPPPPRHYPTELPSSPPPPRRKSRPEVVESPPYATRPRASTSARRPTPESPPAPIEEKPLAAPRPPKATPSAGRAPRRSSVPNLSSLSSRRKATVPTVVPPPILSDPNTETEFYYWSPEEGTLVRILDDDNLELPDGSTVLTFPPGSYRGDVPPSDRLRSHEFIRSQQCFPGCTYAVTGNLKPVRIREHFARCMIRKRSFAADGEVDSLAALCQLQVATLRSDRMKLEGSTAMHVRTRPASATPEQDQETLLALDDEDEKAAAKRQRMT